MLKLKSYLLNIEGKNVKYTFLNKKVFVVINLNFIDYYIELNHDIVLSKISNKILKISSDAYYANLILFLNTFGVLTSKILQIKGLGLKASLIKSSKFIVFKLGFSHIIRIAYDNDIFINVKNNFVFLQSVDKCKLGNFVSFLRSLKTPDSYKGKGIGYKNENKKLKIVKKK